MTRTLVQRVFNSGRTATAPYKFARPRRRICDGFRWVIDQKIDTKYVTFIDGRRNKTYYVSCWGMFAPVCRAEGLMTLSELAERLNIPPRQIRFMIAEGILPPAAKTGRSADAYEEAHVVRGQRYLALYRMGMKPGSIKVLMAFDDAVPILQANGVELRVGPSVSPDTLDIDSILAVVRAALEAYTGKD
jgi:hypothetical protein